MILKIVQNEEKERKKRKEEKEKIILCPFQLQWKYTNSPNICFIVTGSIQVNHENKEKDILKSGSLEKFIDDYNICAVTNNCTFKKTTTFKPY